MDENDLTAGFKSLGDDINKVSGRTATDDTAEGPVSEYLPELSLKMPNDDLVELTKKWKKAWDDSEIKGEWEKQADENYKYWKGEQFSRIESEELRPLQDNQIFQSVETFLPAATRQNPEPLVELRATELQTEDNIKYAEIVRNRLADWADDIKIRLKVKKVGRQWLIRLVGVGKISWDMTNDRPNLRITSGKKLILDPNGITDEDGYSGKYVGEYRKMQADDLIDIVKKEADSDAAVTKIDEESKKEGATDIQFIEWWTDEYMCWILDGVVLRKKKNPHWNYIDEEATSVSQETVDDIKPMEDNPAPETTPEEQPITATAPEGAPALPANTATPAPAMPIVPTATAAPTEAPKLTEKDRNHFPSKKMPYIFLSVFNMGETPVDVTSLITQNLPQQDLINKRMKQIDKNIDGMNGGVVVSEEKSGLTKEEAKGVTDALRRGGTVVVPAGNAQEAVFRMPGVSLPTDVYNNLMDSRNRMYDLFGVRGITPAGIKNEDTVRGKIITKGLDTDRIGGGITEYLEQWCDDVYNYVVQMLYVYDDVWASAQGAKLPRIKVSVKEGSLLPKDATTKANQAIELANGGKMSLIDLYTALEYPDPEKLAANVWLESNAPDVLFKDDPRVAEVMQQKQQQAQQAAQAAAAQGGEKKGPSESISFKDLPPEGKAQMAEQAGIKLSPESIIHHEVVSGMAKEATKAHGSSLLENAKIAKEQNG